MLGAFVNAFRTPDLRTKLLFVLLHHRAVPVRLVVPTPGVNVRQRADLLRGHQSNARLYGLINLFSGGALLQLSVFALGIMPYITASIILQLLDGGHPAAGDAEEGGPGGAGQDHPVHPLPDPRPGHPAVDRHRGAGPQRAAASRAAPGRCSYNDDFVDRSLLMVITMTAGTA